MDAASKKTQNAKTNFITHILARVSTDLYINKLYSPAQTPAARKDSAAIITADTVINLFRFSFGNKRNNKSDSGKNITPDKSAKTKGNRLLPKGIKIRPFADINAANSDKDRGAEMPVFLIIYFYLYLSGGFLNIG